MAASLFSNLDVLTFAEGIVERFEEATPNETTDEARLLYGLAQSYVESFHAAMDDRWKE